MPPFARFTNEQLAAIVQRKVTTAPALAAKGGKARVDKYASAVLGIMRAEAGSAVGDPRGGDGQA